MVLSTPPARDQLQAARRVLHVVPPNGGGVDRFVRDLCRHRPADWIVHVSEAQCVVERPAQAVFVPMAASTFIDLAFSGALGRPQAVHAHTTTPAVRHVVELLCAATRAPAVLTLHDIGFADAAAPSFERSQRLRFARAVAARTAPSRYITGLAGQVLGDLAPCQWVENGVDPWPVQTTSNATIPARDSAVPSGGMAIAVIGAIGEHKGLTALLELAACLPAGLRVVIIGYTAQQLLPGWVVPGRVWMHGVFEPQQLPQLVAQYGARLALFPPGMPESYSYALSDAWMAGLPVVVPDQGALAERVRRHGGGHLYDPQLPAAGIAACVASWATGTPAAAAGRTALTSVQEMVDAMTAIYEAHSASTADAPADLALISGLAQQHLDTQFFRKELLHLQHLLVQQNHVQEQLNQRTVALEAELNQEAQRAQAAEQLRQELATLQLAHAALQRQFEAVLAEQQTQARAREALQSRQDTLQSQYEVLQRRHRTLTGKLALPLRVLPGPWREKLIEVGRRWLN